MPHPALSRVKGLLFDKDGTLFDFHASWSPINLRVALAAARGDETLAAWLLTSAGTDSRTGRSWPDSLIASGTAQELADFWVGQGLDWDRGELRDLLDAMFREGATAMVPVTDLGGLFGSLRTGGYRLGIASSDSEQAIRDAADHFGLSPHLDLVVGYDSGHGRKPEPGMVQAFCRKVALPAYQIAVIGDSRHDMEMARAAGVALRIGVLTGPASRERIAPHADIVIDSIAELPALLQL